MIVSEIATNGILGLTFAVAVFWILLPQED